MSLLMCREKLDIVVLLSSYLLAQKQMSDKQQILFQRKINISPQFLFRKDTVENSNTDTAGHYPPSLSNDKRLLHHALVFHSHFSFAVSVCYSCSNILNCSLD